MMTCRYWRKRIPEALYGEMDSAARGRLDRHLASCAACSELYRALAAAVRQLGARPAPDREPEFWEKYLENLERRMANEPGRTGRVSITATAGPDRRHAHRGFVFGMPQWAAGTAGAVVLIALGILLGRTAFRPVDHRRLAVESTTASAPAGETAAGQPSPEAAATQVALDARTARYLRRSRVILLAVVNADPQAEGFVRLVLPLHKQGSEELLREAAYLKDELRGSDRRLERLVSELEMILLQIANLRPLPDPAAVEIIKAGVETGDIFFKINLSEARRSVASDVSGGEAAGEGSGRPWADIRMAP